VADSFMAAAEMAAPIQYSAVEKTFGSSLLRLDPPFQGTC
jgi:hypothetical protein